MVTGYRHLGNKVLCLSALCAALLLAGCGGEVNVQPTAAAEPGAGTPSGNGTSNSAPKISGVPATAAIAGTPYIFQPTTSDSDGDRLSFTVTNAPAWLSLDATSGKLTGTPATGDVGSWPNIALAVSDGKATASLPAFSIVVSAPQSASVVLSWSTPMANTDGSALTDFSGYLLYYGTSATALTKSVEIGPGLTTLQLDDLAPATWYFAIKVLTQSGAQSELSNIVSKNIG